MVSGQAGAAVGPAWLCDNGYIGILAKDLPPARSTTGVTGNTRIRCGRLPGATTPWKLSKSKLSK